MEPALLDKKQGANLPPRTPGEVPSGKLVPALSDDHAAGDGPRSCDTGTKQLTRLSRSGGTVGREGGFIGRGPVPWLAADDQVQFNDSLVSTLAL